MTKQELINRLKSAADAVGIFMDDRCGGLKDRKETELDIDAIYEAIRLIENSDFAE